MTTTDRALCATELRWTGDLWFSTDPADREQAKEVCGRCPLLFSCAQAGQGHTYGVWGGQDAGDRLTARGVLGVPNPDDDELPPRTARRPCGDEGAYLVHRQRGEDCDICDPAHDARVRAERLVRLGEEHDLGGTSKGAAIHRRLGQQVCVRCRAAAAREQAERKARGRAEGARAWGAATGATGAGNGPQANAKAAA
jgi:hypothetical protein